jgi:hypothetical protein
MSRLTWRSTLANEAGPERPAFASGGARTGRRGQLQTPAELEGFASQVIVSRIGCDGHHPGPGASSKRPGLFRPTTGAAAIAPLHTGRVTEIGGWPAGEGALGFFERALADALCLCNAERTPWPERRPLTQLERSACIM